MALPLIVLRQTLTMALYIAIGFTLFKTKKITLAGSKDLASLLLWLVVPAVLINSFCVPYSPEKLREFGLSFLLGLLALGISMALAALLFRKDAIENLAVAFSNAGFMGIPLVRQSLGEDAVFYLVGFVAALNLFQWSYGLILLGGKKGKGSWKGILGSPVVVGSLIGFLLFVTGLGDKLPGVVEGALKGVVATNSPLAMIVLGVYLAQTELSSLVTTPRLYLLSGARLALIPLVTLVVFRFLPAPNAVKLAILVAAAAPVGSNAAVYAQLYDRDYPYACKAVAQSTVLSVFTLPLMVTLAQWVLGM